MLHLVQIRINQKSFKMKLKCICCVLPIITMRAQDLPAYVKSKKSMMALWMTLLWNSNDKETWNLATDHSPVTLVNVAGLAVLESSLWWSQLHVAREKFQESCWVGYSLYICNTACVFQTHVLDLLLPGNRCAACVCVCVCGNLFLVT